MGANSLRQEGNLPDWSLDIWGLIVGIAGALVGSAGVCISWWIARKQTEQLTELEEVTANTERIARKQTEQLTELKEVTANTERIAQKQTEQLTELEEVTANTEELVKAQTLDRYRRFMVAAFFLRPHDTTRYTCAFPAFKTGKPLSGILAGDYYALHVIQSLLGSENIDFCYQWKDKGPDNRRYQSGNVVFLCSPQANAALSEFAKPGKHGHNVDWPTVFDRSDLPCWFGEDDSKKLILFKSGRRPLESEFEDEYRKCEDNPTCGPVEGARTDYAIVLRLSITENRKVFVVAGIHQPGTWIAGNFLHSLARPYDDQKNVSIGEVERWALLQNHSDFIAIIAGEFDSEKLIVSEPRVFEKCLWLHREGKGWDRMNNAWNTKMRHPGVADSQPVLIEKSAGVSTHATLPPS